MPQPENIAAETWRLHEQSHARQSISSEQHHQGLFARQSSEGTGFGQIVGEFVGKVDRSQRQAEAVVNQVGRGTDGEVHESMMALEKASISLKFGMNCLKKGIEAYKELTQRVS